MPLIFQYSLSRSPTTARRSRRTRGRRRRPVRLDLGQQPARAEADRPRGVGVDLVAVLRPTAGTWARGGCGPTPRRRSARGRSCSACRTRSTSGMKFEMSELPPGLVWKWKMRSCFSQASKHSSAIASVSSSHVPGVGVAAEQERRLQRHHARLAGELQRLARHLRVARQERDPDRGQDAVVGRRRVHDDVVEVEGDLVHRDAVVGHRERALDLELVHVVLHELGGRCGSRRPSA